MTKELIGCLSIVSAAVGYGLYVLSIFRGKTHPHLFSWLVWGIATAVVCVAQESKNGEAGSWAAGFSSIVSFIIAGLALRYGERKITRLDWAAFLGALVSIPIWYFSKNPLWSVVLLTIIDQFGFYPTFRKSYMKPREESVWTYVLDIFKYVFSLLALGSYSWVTALFPTVVIISNGCFLLMLKIRYRQVTS